MCEACTIAQRLRRYFSHLPDDVRDPIERAQRRLRCYYECVTQDMNPFPDDEDESEDDLESWLPEM